MRDKKVFFVIYACIRCLIPFNFAEIGTEVFFLPTPWSMMGLPQTTKRMAMEMPARGAKAKMELLRTEEEVVVAVIPVVVSLRI